MTPVDRWEGESVDHWREHWGLPELHVYRRVGSTMDVARRLAEAGAPAGTLVLAEEQTAGRGRKGRRWHAAAGTALLLSVVLRPRPGPGDALVLGTVPLRLGLAVCDAVEEVAPVRALVKWPNDVVIKGQGKLAGIICEGALTEAGGFMVAGIGVNVSQRPDDWPPELRGAATSLALAAGQPISRTCLAAALVERLSYAMYEHAKPLDADTIERLEARDLLSGHAIEVDGQRAGTARGFMADGALRVQSPDGHEQQIRHGTVRLARDALHS